MNETTKLEKALFDYEGKTYEIIVNYNVLADLIDYFGEVPNLLGKVSLNVYTAVLAFAMNEYAEQKGWEERFTPKGIGRSLDVDVLKDRKFREKMMEIMNVAISALYSKKENGEEEPEKN